MVAILRSNSRRATSVLARREQANQSDPTRDGGTEIAPAFTSIASAEITAIVVIDQHALTRECFARSLKACEESYCVSAFASVAQWQELVTTHARPSVIILCSYRHTRAQTELDLAALSKSATGIPVVIVGDDQDVEHVRLGLAGGARGYIPSSVTLEVAVAAIQLVRAGGTFVPAGSLIALRSREGQVAVEKEVPEGLFTARQSAIVEAVRKGKANKVIAYELNMRESTVKVHVRNIMKKLKARNRTEVAFLTSNLFSGIQTCQSSFGPAGGICGAPDLRA
jgi:DNA-binding NarL/FixJ family response regulator